MYVYFNVLFEQFFVISEWKLFLHHIFSVYND